MVHENTLKAHKATADLRNRQIDEVFDYLYARSQVQPVTAEELSAVLRIPRSTIHARLNDLRHGYYHKGAYYFLDEVGVLSKPSGRDIALYSLTLTEPDPRNVALAEIKQLERKIKRHTERLAALKCIVQFYKES